MGGLGAGLRLGPTAHIRATRSIALQPKTTESMSSWPKVQAYISGLKVCVMAVECDLQAALCLKDTVSR